MIWNSTQTTNLKPPNLPDLDLENLDLPTTCDESKDESTGGGVAGDGSNGWDGEGEEGDDDWSEGFDHLVEAEASRGLALRDVDAIAEELAASDGDESGAAIDGLGVDLGESGEERVDEVWAKTVLVIVANEC